MLEVTEITTLKLSLLSQELCSMKVHRMLLELCRVCLILRWTNPTAYMNLGLQESLICCRLCPLVVTEMLQNTATAVLTSSTVSARKGGLKEKYMEDLRWCAFAGCSLTLRW